MAARHHVCAHTPHDHLDASHEKGETLIEMTQAFALLEPGGVLVGDDLDWPAVLSDLLIFCEQKGADMVPIEVTCHPGLTESHNPHGLTSAVALPFDSTPLTSTPFRPSLRPTMSFPRYPTCMPEETTGSSTRAHGSGPSERDPRSVGSARWRRW